MLINFLYVYETTKIELQYEDKIILGNKVGYRPMVSQNEITYLSALFRMDCPKYFEDFNHLSPSEILLWYLKIFQPAPSFLQLVEEHGC